MTASTAGFTPAFAKVSATVCPLTVVVCFGLPLPSISDARPAALTALAKRRPLSADVLEKEHALLAQRLVDGRETRDAVELWQRIGVTQAARVPDMNATQVRALRPREESTQ